MIIDVECYAGYKGDERPLRFRMGGREYDVEELLDQWYSPDDTWFRVRANDANIYVLRHRHTAQENQWGMESYRRADKDS